MKWECERDAGKSHFPPEISGKLRTSAGPFHSRATDPARENARSMLPSRDKRRGSRIRQPFRLFVCIVPLAETGQPVDFIKPRAAAILPPPVVLSSCAHPLAFLDASLNLYFPNVVFAYKTIHPGTRRNQSAHWTKHWQRARLKTDPLCGKQLVSWH